MDLGRHAVPADRRGEGGDLGTALPGGAAEIRALSAPDRRLCPAERVDDALDAGRDRDRIGQDGILPLADP